MNFAVETQAGRKHYGQALVRTIAAVALWTAVGCGGSSGAPTITSMPTPVASQSASPTATSSSTPTLSATATTTGTASPTPSPTRTTAATASGTPTPTATASPTATSSSTPTLSATATTTGTASPTPSPTPTTTATASGTPTPTATQTATPSPTATPMTGLTGQVVGSASRNPISGSTVTLYTVGPAGSSCSGAECYGAGASALASTTSDSSGSFAIGPYTCPSANPQTYVLATGGDAGSGSNSGIAMMSLSGPCNSLTSSALVVNELTTIAAQWALARFIGLTGQIIGSSSTNATGLNNAVNLAFNDLVSITGVPAGFLPTTAQCSSGSPPVNCDGLERLDTLANSIASCINSSGSSSTQCEQLFCAATPDATWNGASCSKTPAPTDTLAAAHAIVTNPTANADTIFGVSPPPGLTLFEPVLSSAPADWTLALNFAPPDANFGEPASLALDSAGNVWVGNNYDGVTELDSNGALVGNFNPPGANFDWPVYLAIDSTTRNVWVTNWYGNSVTELNSKGALVGNFAPAGANFLEPGVEALDVKDNLWVVNSPGGAPATRPAQSYLGNSVTELNSSGALVGNFAPVGANFSGLVGLVLDTKGNVWVTNYLGNSVTELDSSGALVGNFAPAGANFNGPRGVALGSLGNVWVVNAAATP